MSNKLSPELITELKKDGVDLSEKEMESLNEILPDSASELTIDQLNAVAGGELSKLKKVGIAAAIVATAVLADVGQAYYRLGDDVNGVKGTLKGMEKNSVLLTAAQALGKATKGAYSKVKGNKVQVFEDND